MDNLTEITMSDKTEHVAELSQFATDSKSFGSLTNVSESDLTPVAVGSSEVFASTARTTAVETTGVRGLSNGQALGEHTSVSSLWSDMSAMQLGGSDIMSFSGTNISLYAPLMVGYACLCLVLVLLHGSCESVQFAKCTARLG